MRGILTKEINEKANAFLHRDISQKELRLYPYIDYSIKNNCQGWNYQKLDSKELEILDILYQEKHIVYSSEKIITTRKFYDFIQDILALSYVTEFLK